MDKMLVAEIGLEGGGTTIYGRQDEGVWSFWEEGSSWGLDENDEEVVWSWSSEPVANLGPLVPPDWPMYYALTIHPDFIGWFREHYEGARASLRPDLKAMHAEHQHRRWGQVLEIS